MKALRALAIVGAGVSGLLSFGTVAYADEAENGSLCPNYPWPYQGILSSNDHSSTRRGQKVFQSDCSSCHSTSLVSYRDLANVAHTKEEANGIKAEIEVGRVQLKGCADKSISSFEEKAKNLGFKSCNQTSLVIYFLVVDGSNHEGEMFTCLGKLNDSFLPLYPNEKAAKFAYGRAYSPDLSLITRIREGLNYNPYFSGGAIAMPKLLKNSFVEYEL